MQLKDLPQEIQDKLLEERKQLCEKWHRNTPWEVCFVNKDGTRFFHAYRKNDYGSWDYGCKGGWWNVSYGVIRWRHRVEQIKFIGETVHHYEWVESETYKKSVNGTDVPREVHTKKEVLDLAKRIGIFNLD